MVRLWINPSISRPPPGVIICLLTVMPWPHFWPLSDAERNRVFLVFYFGFWCFCLLAGWFSSLEWSSGLLWLLWLLVLWFLGFLTLSSAFGASWILYFFFFGFQWLLFHSFAAFWLMLLSGSVASVCSSIFMYFIVLLWLLWLEQLAEQGYSSRNGNGIQSKQHRT